MTGYSARQPSPATTAPARSAQADGAPDPWGVRKAENLLTSLEGILSARVVTTPLGEVSEVHILAQAGLQPKQLVRNIESALLAQLGLKVDHRKISIAQTAEVRPIEALERDAVRDKVMQRSLLFENLSVAPGKRPFHTIIPAFLTKDGQPVMSFGVMGGNMQPQGHMQTLVRMLDYKQNPQAACDAPRWRFNQGLEINVERAMDPALVRGLEARGHQVEVINDSYQDFGAGQFIWRLGDPGVDGYVAASDPRRDGQAVVY